jgi:dTDP-4-dehydrorhamnose 3,5-epimerase
MQITSLAIPDVKLLTPKKFGDDRGFFSETYNARTLAGLGVTETFVQDNHSLSGPVGTVRGLHFQKPPHAQAKLVRVVRGRIFDVAVDIRQRSATYGQWVGVELSAENWQQLYIPAGFAHGFCTLEPETEVLYKTTDFYAPELDAGLHWRDPAFDIAWPVAAADATLSAKDLALPCLAAVSSPFSTTATA